MKNDVYNTLRVKTVCENKLNIVFRDGSEFNRWFIYEGRKIARITVPHGRKPIPPKTYKSMAQQLKLPIEDFDELLDCPLKYDDYIKILKENKFVS
ncbi:hypothetical protein [Desulfovibrio piger]|uniref:hypothetical protein n=1 Tax=Desulfovibrio piger TaxID=901 RepID=UPI0026EF11FC|nr:hypothetical protein [Desulfovibrio piger]